MFQSRGDLLLLKCFLMNPDTDCTCTQTDTHTRAKQQVVSEELEMCPVMFYRQGSKVEGGRLSRAHF